MGIGRKGCVLFPIGRYGVDDVVGSPLDAVDGRNLGEDFMIFDSASG
tara:strand:- start:43 stop:183 length:141 start_codon:yes stop_codon:yes gene_type:complete